MQQGCFRPLRIHDSQGIALAGLSTAILHHCHQATFAATSLRLPSRYALLSQACISHDVMYKEGRPGSRHMKAIASMMRSSLTMAAALNSYGSRPPSELSTIKPFHITLLMRYISPKPPSAKGRLCKPSSIMRPQESPALSKPGPPVLWPCNGVAQLRLSHCNCSCRKLANILRAAWLDTRAPGFCVATLMNTRLCRLSSA